MLVVFGVLCTGVAAGFGVSERVQQREMLWRWLLDRSERTIDDVAYRFGELWLKQLRLDANSPHFAVLDARMRTERNHLERLGKALVADESGAECSQYPGGRQRLRAFDPYLLPNLRSANVGGETEIFVNCTESEVAYYWVDRDGAERYYGHVAPRADVIQHTIEGYRPHQDLSVFRAARSISLAVVTSGRGSRPESQYHTRTRPPASGRGARSGSCCSASAVIRSGSWTSSPRERYWWRSATVGTRCSSARPPAAGPTLYLRENPWHTRRRCNEAEWEQKALEQGMIAVNSILRDWVRGQVTAIETASPSSGTYSCPTW